VILVLRKHFKNLKVATNGTTTLYYKYVLGKCKFI